MTIDINNQLELILYYLLLERISIMKIQTDNMSIGSYLVSFLYPIALGQTDNISIESYLFSFSLLYSTRIDLSY